MKYFIISILTAMVFSLTHANNADILNNENAGKECETIEGNEVEMNKVESDKDKPMFNAKDIDKKIVGGSYTIFLTKDGKVFAYNKSTGKNALLYAGAAKATNIGWKDSAKGILNISTINGLMQYDVATGKASYSSAQELKPPFDKPKERNEKLSNLRFWEKQLKEYKNNKPKTQRELLQDKIDSKKAEAEKAKNNLLSEENFATVNALEAEIKNLKDSLALLPPDPKEDKTLDKIQDERDFLVLEIYLLDILDNKCPDNFDYVVAEAETKLNTIKTPDIKSVATSFLPMLKNYERYTAELYNFMTSEKNKAMNIIFGADEKMPNNIDQEFMSTLKKTEYYKYYQNFKQDKYAPSIAYLNVIVDRIIEMKDSRLKGATARVAKMAKDFIIEDLTIESKEHMEELVANTNNRTNRNIMQRGR